MKQKGRGKKKRKKKNKILSDWKLNFFLENYRERVWLDVTEEM